MYCIGIFYLIQGFQIGERLIHPEKYISFSAVTQRKILCCFLVIVLSGNMMQSIASYIGFQPMDNWGCFFCVTVLTSKPWWCSTAPYYVHLFSSNSISGKRISLYVWWISPGREFYPWISPVTLAADADLSVFVSNYSPRSPSRHSASPATSRCIMASYTPPGKYCWWKKSWTTWDS